MDRLHAVIRDFYEASLNPDHWETAFDGLGDLLGGCAMGSSLQSSGGHVVLAFSRLDPAFTGILEANYATINTNPMVAVMGKLPAGRAFARAWVVPDEDYHKTDLFNDVFQPQGLEHAAVVCGIRSGGSFAPVGIFNRTGRDFGEEELSIVNLVAPHIEKALQVHLRIGSSEAAHATAWEALEHLPFGVMFVSSDGSIWKLNRAAEGIIRSGDGLSYRDGKVRAALATDQQLLNSLLASAMGTMDNETVGCGGWLAISRPSGARPLGALVSPLPLQEFWPDGKPGAILFVSDPERRVAPAVEALTEIFGLTPAQAQIASLLATGLTVEEAAYRTNVTTHTARVHLKQAFERTSTSRQADLVRAVLSSVALLSDRDIADT